MADKEPSTSLKQAALFETVGSTPKIDSPTSVPARPWSKRKHIVLGAGIGFCVAIKWLRAVNREQGVKVSYQRGTVCKIRQPAVVASLLKHFPDTSGTK